MKDSPIFTEISFHLISMLLVVIVTMLSWLEIIMFPTIEYYKLGVAEEAEKSAIAREIASHSGLSDKGFYGDDDGCLRRLVI